MLNTKGNFGMRVLNPLTQFTLPNLRRLLFDSFLIRVHSAFSFSYYTDTYVCLCAFPAIWKIHMKTQSARARKSSKNSPIMTHWNALSFTTKRPICLRFVSATEGRKKYKGNTYSDALEFRKSIGIYFIVVFSIKKFRFNLQTFPFLSLFGEVFLKVLHSLYIFFPSSATQFERPLTSLIRYNLFNVILRNYYYYRIS